VSHLRQAQIEEFNALIRECETFLFATRESALQRDASERMGSLLTHLHALKAEAIRMNDEDRANLLLGYECVAECLIHELTMWIRLKEGTPDAAWDSLVGAQMAAAAAARAHRGFGHLSRQAQRLEAIETIVFPPQVFISTGWIVGYQECSICAAEYGECGHVAGRPYMGKFCAIVAGDLKANHVAIVESPADKRCRITHFDVDGGRRNRMTWAVEAVETRDTRDASAPSTLVTSAVLAVAAER
jgi:hypothetical protein